MNTFKNILKTHLLFVTLLFLATNAFAAGYKHQIEGSFNLDNRTIDYDNGGEDDFDIFQILGTYRNQYKQDLFLVGNLELSNGGYDYIAFSGGAEWNFVKTNDKLEAGAGAWFRIFTGDISGFGVRPYGFLRSFITNQLFISGVLSYDLGFVDVNNRDGDLKGIQITAGLGYAF